MILAGTTPAAALTALLVKSLRSEAGGESAESTTEITGE
jgi:hypothetical protein